MMGQAVEQGAGQPLGSKHAGPFVERQIAGHEGRAPFVTLAEDLEQQFGAGLQAFLAGCKTQSQSNVGFAGARIADRDNVLASLDIFRARQLHHESFIQGRKGCEVEAVEALHGRELGRLDTALDHAALAIDQLRLGKPQQITRIVDAFGGALARHLVILAQERRQLERLEVVRQEHLRRIGDDAAPVSRPI